MGGTVERVRSGIARARERGTKSGKAIGRPRVSADKEAAVRAALAAGKGMTAISRDLHGGNHSMLSDLRVVQAAVRVAQPRMPQVVFLEFRRSFPEDGSRS